MNNKSNITHIQKFHSFLWWVIAILFATISIKPFIPDLFGSNLTRYGVLFLISATVLRAVVLANYFHKENQKTNFWLSLCLILLIGLAATIGMLT